MKKLILCLTAACLALSIGSAQAALSLNLTYVAKSGQSAPDGSKLLFSSFDIPQLNKGYVTFVGSNTIGQQALYTNLYGHLATAASTTTLIPDSNDTFTSFDNTASLFNTPDSNTSSIYDNKIVFLGTNHLWQTGLYFKSSQNSNVQLIASTDTPSPGTKSDFTAFAYPRALANGGTAFWAASNDGSQGLYYATSDGKLSKLVDTNTTIPQGTGSFTSFAYASFSNNSSQPKSCAFIGYGSDKQSGLYLIRNDKLSLIANTKTKLPDGGVGFFTKFSNVSYDAITNEIAFIGNGILGQHAIFVYSQGKISQLVSQHTPIPGGFGEFKSFTHPNMESGFVLFQAKDSKKQDGLYLFSTKGEKLKILSDVDHINKEQVKNVNIGNQSLSGNQVAARVTFKDGTSGVYIITMTNMK